MKDLVGSPGTWTSLMLRLLQSVCAAASSLNMASTYGVSTNHYRAFWYLIVTMAVQSFWSLLLACADVYSLKTKADLHSPGLVKTFVVGDWIIATNSFAAISASAGLTILFTRDTKYCVTMVMQQLCIQYKLSIILASITWSLMAASALSMFWLLASLD